MSFVLMLSSSLIILIHAANHHGINFSTFCSLLLYISKGSCHIQTNLIFQISFLSISKNIQVIKFLFLRFCLSQLFTSKHSFSRLLLRAKSLNNLVNRVIINHALIQCPVASHIKNVYFSLVSFNQKASQDILSAQSIFQNKS
jgi:hypothetical protein